MLIGVLQIHIAIERVKLIKVSLYKPGDGDQDLSFYFRKPLEVLQELISDVKAAGKQYFVYQEYKNEHGERVFYHTNGTLWWQRAQERAVEIGGSGTGVLSIIVSIDATYVKKNTYFRPIYRKYSYFFILFHTFSYFSIFKFILFHAFSYNTYLLKT